MIRNNSPKNENVLKIESAIQEVSEFIVCSLEQIWKNLPLHH